MLRHPALFCAVLAAVAFLLVPATATEEYALDGATVTVRKTDGFGTFWWFTDMHVDIWGTMKDPTSRYCTSAGRNVNGIEQCRHERHGVSTDNIFPHPK